ncbi:hypothetical protein PanWU01x14_023510 [Parasponia andersonii]|uniref:Uncharacterized protein n=1 Tax=Parasponia andersonii TaxID=3476 RepID=A0A2P5DXH5_PARAD|nr:hypothetical protein PanWU01x14_023510 [Parasponia andersonii]
MGSFRNLTLGKLINHCRSQTTLSNFSLTKCSRFLPFVYVKRVPTLPTSTTPISNIKSWRPLASEFRKALPPSFSSADKILLRSPIQVHIPALFFTLSVKSDQKFVLKE